MIRVWRAVQAAWRAFRDEHADDDSNVVDLTARIAQREARR